MAGQIKNLLDLDSTYVNGSWIVWGMVLHIYSAVDQGTEVHLHLFQGQRVRE